MMPIFFPERKTTVGQNARGIPEGVFTVDLGTIVVVGLVGWLAYKVNVLYLKIGKKIAAPLGKAIIKTAVKGHPFN
jgi:hypothetical protein